MKIKSRKMLFLSTIISRGTQPRKAPEDGIEVSQGFAEAAEKLGSDDNRAPEQKGAVGEQAPPEDPDEGGDDEGGEDGDEGGEEGDEEGAPPEEEPAARKKKGTSDYIRELKREKREATRRAENAEALLRQPPQPVLPPQIPGGNYVPTREPPNPNDEAKYPLGVYDDGYIEDKIEWAAEQQVQKALDGKARADRAIAEQRAEQAHLSNLRSKVDDLADTGSELYDDYDEVVVQGGMAKKFDLSETTFTAATEVTHGAKILYDLAKDKKEASRVFSMSPTQQTKYVLDKDAEIAKATQPRTRPRASDTPGNLPRGRNSSNPIRPDTDNLRDFRKLWYGKK